VHYRLLVRHQGREGRGSTENLSERGAMLSVDIDPALSASDELELELELPQVGSLTVRATVRWASAVLPGMIGVEFDAPIQAELLAHFAMLVMQLELDDAQGF